MNFMNLVILLMCALKLVPHCSVEPQDIFRSAALGKSRNQNHQDKNLMVVLCGLFNPLGGETSH